MSRRPFTDISWHLDGLCRQVDGDLWYAHAKDVESQSQAVEICGRCDSDVRAKCLRWAIDNQEEWGIWGGQPPHRRVDIVLLMRRMPELSVLEAAEMVDQDPALQVTPARRINSMPAAVSDGAAAAA